MISPRDRNRNRAAVPGCGYRTTTDATILPGSEADTARSVVRYVGVGGVGARQTAEQAPGLVGAEPGEPPFSLDQGDAGFGGGGDATHDRDAPPFCLDHAAPDPERDIQRHRPPVPDGQFRGHAGVAGHRGGVAEKLVDQHGAHAAVAVHRRTTTRHPPAHGTRTRTRQYS